MHVKICSGTNKVSKAGPAVREITETGMRVSQPLLLSRSTTVQVPEAFTVGVVALGLSKVGKAGRTVEAPGDRSV